MPITHCIAHSLHRPSADAAVNIVCPKDSLSIDGAVQELVSELKQAYVGKAGKVYGQLDPDLSVSLVSQWLREFLEQKMSFLSFTQKATEHLKNLWDDTEVIEDGHLVYVVESLAEGDFLTVFFVRHNEGYFINTDLTLDISRFLDVRGVLLGCRLCVTEWQSESPEPGYLSVLRARGDKDFTDTFWKWIGFTDERDITAETTHFLTAVSNFSASIEDEEQQQQCRHAVIDYCLEQDKRGEPVVIRDLSQHLDEKEPERFERFFQEKSEQPMNELIPDRRQIKQYLRISGRNDRLSMSFDVECIGDSIVYDQGADSLTVKNIPAPLKLKLLKFLQDKPAGED